MFELNKNYHGFEFNEKKHVEELRADAYIGRHTKSGARIIYIAADDENKVFSISFKTVPDNDTGVMHILEHSVLNGSDKYPVREPFVELLKSSMQTFLNAMTYPDKTMYPVASCNEKDFENLMDVYLDAVFHPAIYNKKEIFLQEGWHYEGGEKECFRGVVYNEMKGEMSSEDSLLGEYLQNTMFPDVCYSKNSGGDPKAIPNLTYEEFIETHKKFYHPCNSYIYLYGNMDAEEKLRLMDEGYLNAYEDTHLDVKVGVQSDKGYLYKEACYDSDENKEGATHYAFGFKAAAFDEHEKLMATDILLSSICSNNESPLKKALLDKGICEEVWAYLDDQLVSPYVCLTLKKCGSDGEKVKETVREIIEDIVKSGIDKEIILANINQTEFKMREAEFGNQPAGLIYCTWVMASWLYGGDPTLLLSYEKEFKAIREKAKGDYFERLLEEIFLSSKHNAFVKLSPDASYAEKKAKAEEERVQAYRESIGEEGIKKAEEELEALRKMQNSEDSPEALSTIPVVDLKYIKPEAEKIPFEKKELDGCEALYHDIATKRILYMSLYFNLDALDCDGLVKVSLASRFLGRLATKKKNAQEVINAIKINLGAFSASVDTFAPLDNREKVSAKLRISFSALEDNIGNAMELVGEILNETDFEESVSEIKKMLLQEKMGRESWMTRNGHSAALRRAMSYFSYEDELNQKLNGVDYFFYVKSLSESLNEGDAKELGEIIKTAVTGKNVTYSVTGGEEILNGVTENIDKLNLADGEDGKRAELKLQCEAKNEGFIVPTDVAYVAKAATAGEAKGSMFVLSHIMTYDYLWNTIRAKGGAYGTGFTVNLLGDVGMYSYRDPNLKDTVTAFDEAYKYLEAFEATEREMTKYIVGAVAATDRPKSAFSKATRSDADYFNSIAPCLRDRIRSEMLNTTVDDIKESARMLKELMEEGNLCVFSSKARIEKNAELFKNTVVIK
ncbi:MAG: insulinase family protein [Clostridia bacterium]|nr:insulinase family protein [Clostridia bacterium]